MKSLPQIYLSTLKIAIFDGQCNAKVDPDFCEDGQCDSNYSSFKIASKKNCEFRHIFILREQLWAGKYEKCNLKQQFNLRITTSKL